MSAVSSFIIVIAVRGVVRAAASCSALETHQSRDRTCVTCSARVGQAGFTLRRLRHKVNVVFYGNVVQTVVAAGVIVLALLIG